MNAPDKIYIREYPDGINKFWDEKKRDGVVATIHHEYIRKAVLLEWAKKQKAWLNQGYKKDWKNEDTLNGGRLMLDKLINKIESL